MSKLLSLLIAATFATVSMGALAAAHTGGMKDDKAMTEKKEEKAEMKEEKKTEKKAAKKTKKAAKAEAKEEKKEEMKK